MDASTPIADVLRHAQRLEPDACAELWRRFAPAVVGYLRSRGSYDPEDLASETFIAVFRALPTFVGGEPEFRALLFTVARRRLVDEMRTRSRRAGEREWVAEQDPRQAPSAEHSALDELGTARAMEQLRQLSSDQREVLMLRILGDLTIEQIATIVNKSPGAVKALQRRGLATLRRQLGERFEEST